MKFVFFFFSIFFASIGFAQNTPIESDNLKIKIDKLAFFQDMMGFRHREFGLDPNNLDKLVEFYFYLKIEGFDTNNPIDFNLFSLVEFDEKLRQRPVFIEFRTYLLSKYDVDQPSPDDNFLKYHQEGITDYDHFFRNTPPFKKTTVSKQRFYIANIPAKKNKKGEFVICFPVKTRKSGAFSLYYRDILIKNFIVKPGQRLYF